MGKELNQWIRQQLKNREWSTNELARRSGLSSAYVSNILNGKRQPGAKLYYGLAKAFEVRVDAIERLDRKGERPDFSDSEEISLRDFLKIIGDLTPERREEVVEFFISLKHTDDVDDSQTDEEDGEIKEGDETEES